MDGAFILHQFELRLPERLELPTLEEIRAASIGDPLGQVDKETTNTSTPLLLSQQQQKQVVCRANTFPSNYLQFPAVDSSTVSLLSLLQLQGTLPSQHSMSLSNDLPSSISHLDALPSLSPLYRTLSSSPCPSIVSSDANSHLSPYSMGMSAQCYNSPYGLWPAMKNNLYNQALIDNYRLQYLDLQTSLCKSNLINEPDKLYPDFYKNYNYLEASNNIIDSLSNALNPGVANNFSLYSSLLSQLQCLKSLALCGATNTLQGILNNTNPYQNPSSS